MISQTRSDYHIVCSPTERYDPVVPTGLEERQTLLDAADTLLEAFLPPDRYGDSMTRLGVHCSGRQIHRDYSNIRQLTTGYESQPRLQRQAQAKTVVDDKISQTMQGLPKIC